MDRRHFLAAGAGTLAARALGAPTIAPEMAVPATAAGAMAATHAKPLITQAAKKPLTPPAKGKIDVAIVLAPGATMIDFGGPYEVFQDVHVMERGTTMDEIMPFRLFTVAETTEAVHISSGMQVVPDYGFDKAPTPRVVVVPALRGNEALHRWLREVSPRTDITMSVCTGAFQLAAAGLLDGLMATTHHAFLDKFEQRYPKVKLQRGVRLVDNGHIATAGGLSSGIDLALHVVRRYFGTGPAEWTAEYMEYTGEGWRS